ncbi:MAG TPA: hypothetical protein VIL31_04880 [Cyclobacteriaceae bacterium]|jgi:hypothetical protein
MGRFYRWGLIILTLATLAVRTDAQPVNPAGVAAAADPASMNSRIRLDFESYFFFQPARFYAVRLGYVYGLRNGRHLFGLSVPFVHSIFDEDYQGFENTTGIGDFEMWYMTSFHTGRSIGFTRISPFLEISAPTGEYLLGRGAGSWLYKPGVVFTWVIDPQVAFHPQVRYQFSGKEANSTSGVSGIPDIEHPEKDGRLQNLSVELPVVVQFEPFQAWLGINTQYQQALVVDEYFLFMRLDFGKMITERTAASLHLSKFIAGQPRLNVGAQARLQIFLR